MVSGSLKLVEKDEGVSAQLENKNHNQKFRIDK